MSEKLSRGAKLLTEIGNLDCPIKLYRTGRSFSVVYGLQITNRLSYTKAAEEFGLCVLHSAACKGLLDINQGPDDLTQKEGVRS